MSEDRRHQVGRFDRSYSSGSLVRALLEHLEHPVGDDEAADDVGRREDHGDEREHMLQAGSAVPTTSIAPTITIPWIAFVPDISGVCSIDGTFEITSMPTKVASTRIVISATSC